MSLADLIRWIRRPHAPYDDLRAREMERQNAEARTIINHEREIMVMQAQNEQASI